jgi:hypothetical protein
MPIPWKSKLNPYENEILRMWNNRTTLPEIQTYLREKEIEISQQGIWKFIEVRTRKRNPHDIKFPDEKTSETIEKNTSSETSRNIPTEPTPIVPPKIKTEASSEIEEDKSKKMSELRKELKRQAHADPMKNIFIRKGEKR